MRSTLALLAALALAQPAAAQDQRPTFVIIAMGDSYASGEGDPGVAGNYAIDGRMGTAEVWTDTADVAAFQDAWRCHRSPNAGAGRAAARLRQTFPNINFVYVSFACSGAKASTGILQPFDGADDQFMNLPPLPSQIDQAAAFLATRPGQQVDAVVMNIGGNDAGFGQIIQDCLSTAILGGCHTNPTTRALIDGGIAALSGPNGLYAQINQQLVQRIAPARIYLTEVPNPTRGSNGALCHHQPLTDPLLNRASREEGQFIETLVVNRLNTAFGTAAASMQPRAWQMIGGIADDYRLHGICSNASWFRDNFTALRMQGPEALNFGISTESWRLEIGLVSAGFMHPNGAGYQAIGNRIAAALEGQVRERFSITRAPQLALDSVSSPVTLSTTIRTSSPSTAIGSTPRAVRRPTGTVALSWTDPAPGATTKFVLTINGRETDLPAGTTRHVVRIDGRVVAQVRACGPLGCGPASNQIDANNLVPGTPTGLRKATGPGTVQWAGVIPLSWTAADANQEYFEVSWRPESPTLTAAQPAQTSSRTRVQPGTTAGRAALTGETVSRAEGTTFSIGSARQPLASGTSYVIRVRACSTAGCSEWTPAMTETPGAPAPVRTVVPRR